MVIITYSDDSDDSDVNDVDNKSTASIVYNRKKKITIKKSSIDNSYISYCNSLHFRKRIIFKKRDLYPRIYKLVYKSINLIDWSNIISIRSNIDNVLDKIKIEIKFKSSRHQFEKMHAIKLLKNIIMNKEIQIIDNVLIIPKEVNKYNINTNNYKKNRIKPSFTNNSVKSEVDIDGIIFYS